MKTIKILKIIRDASSLKIHKSLIQQNECTTGTVGSSRKIVRRNQTGSRFQNGKYNKLVLSFSRKEDSSPCCVPCFTKMASASAAVSDDADDVERREWRR